MLMMHLPVEDSRTYGGGLTCYFRGALVSVTILTPGRVHWLSTQHPGPLLINCLVLWASKLFVITGIWGFLGGSAARSSFVLGKVYQWVLDINNLSHVAISQPQVAYSALVKSLQQEWIYVRWVVPDCCSLFTELEEALLSSFLPAMFGCEISSLEQKLFSLSVHLGLDLPTVSANSLYAACRHATEVIVSAIISATPFEPSAHDDLVFVAQRHYQKQLDTNHEALFSEICLELDPLHQRAVERARANDLSAWLSVMPIEKDNYDLTGQEFRDALAVRHRKPLLCIPPRCDGCSAPSSLDHFLICRKGGLIVQQHNEICHAISDLAALLWGQVKREPVVSEDGDDGTLVANLGVHGVWSPQSEVLFDIHVTTLTSSPIFAMHLSPFCFGLRLRKGKSILLLLMLAMLTLPPFAFQLMAWLVLKLLAVLRDLLLDCHRNGRRTTLKFCAGFVPDMHLRYCVPLDYV